MRTYIHIFFHSLKRTHQVGQGWSRPAQSPDTQAFLGQRSGLDGRGELKV